MLNFKLAKEIYGVTPWMMDVHSVPVMSSILADIRAGVNFGDNHEKLNNVSVICPTSETKLIRRPWQLDNKEQFEGIGIISLNGPITKSGGMSSFGMAQLAVMMFQMAADDRIKAFLIITDSGGGSSSAVEIMNDAINTIKETKPVYALIEKGGMAASAAYGIISGCTQIFSESDMNMVGSVGTMIQFEGKEANSKSPDGSKNIRLYATKSVKKNEGFEQALNKNNFKILVNKLLDPINEGFISMVLENRPKLEGTDFDNGDIHFAKDVIGTFVDKIMSFSETINLIESKHIKASERQEFNTNSNNINAEQMTKAEFKAANPTAYDEIVAEGIAQERDRAGAWMAHVHTDPESVKNGIEGGKNLTQSERENFFVKQNAKGTADGMKSDSPGAINTPESKTDLKKVELEAKEKEVKAAFDFNLK